MFEMVSYIYVGMCVIVSQSIALWLLLIMHQYSGEIHLSVAIAMVLSCHFPVFAWVEFTSIQHPLDLQV